MFMSTLSIDLIPNSVVFEFEKKMKNILNCSEIRWHIYVCFKYLDLHVNCYLRTGNCKF